MYILNRENNALQEVKRYTFHELGFGERKHLQEWIAQYPRTLCVDDDDDLLIIQKEFSGFEDTNERLDLLALDKHGTLVIIENKLDDSGRDVTWQALKYVAYCSTLTSEQIKEIYQEYLDRYCNGGDAEYNLVTFFDDTPFDDIPLNTGTQRIILVAANFRKEVTSTVMWLRDNGLQIQCFRATPYQWESQVFLDVEQIIPIKEAEEYLVKKAVKDRDAQVQTVATKSRHDLRRKFWAQLLDAYRTKDHNFDNVTPSKDHWLNCGSGVSGCGFAFLFTTNYAGVELSINIGDQDRNKALFDILYSNHQAIDTNFGQPLTWERLDDKKMCRVILRNTGLNIKEEADWGQAIQLLCEQMPKLIKALRTPLKTASQNIPSISAE